MRLERRVRWHRMCVGRRGRAAGLTWNARLRNLASILRTMESCGRA